MKGVTTSLILGMGWKGMVKKGVPNLVTRTRGEVVMAANNGKWRTHQEIGDLLDHSSALRPGGLRW